MSEIVERVARAIGRHHYQADFNGFGQSTQMRLRGNAEAALIVFREILLEEVAAIRREGHLTDTDAEQGMREMRALAVWRVAEKIGGNGND